MFRRHSGVIKNLALNFGANSHNTKKRSCFSFDILYYWFLQPQGNGAVQCGDVDYFIANVCGFRVIHILLQYIKITQGDRSLRDGENSVKLTHPFDRTPNQVTTSSQQRGLIVILVGMSFWWFKSREKYLACQNLQLATTLVTVARPVAFNTIEAV